MQSPPPGWWREFILASPAHAGDLAPQKIAIGDLVVRQIDKGGEFGVRDPFAVSYL